MQISGTLFRKSRNLKISKLATTFTQKAKHRETKMAQKTTVSDPRILIRKTEFISKKQSHNNVLRFHAVVRQPGKEIYDFKDLQACCKVTKNAKHYEKKGHYTTKFTVGRHT